MYVLKRRFRDWRSGAAFDFPSRERPLESGARGTEGKENDLKRKRDILLKTLQC